MDAKTGRPEPYLKGKDPMEIVHDRERERYSKHISRTFTRGTYYLEVNANHPDYILRTRVLPVPPYDDPARAVEAGMHYIINVGDAWFAQIPREGNIYVRADNLHDTATRCTACHPSSFSTEANLVAHRNGYPIRSKSNFQYVIDRLYNSPTPLYGDEGLYWQRFIAIPLQAQGHPGRHPARLRGAGLGRADEDRRAVRAVPAEGLGVAAATCRTTSSTASSRSIASSDSPGATGASCARSPGGPGEIGYAKAADRIASILGERAADRRIETLQDRIHRLYAWWLIDRGEVRQQDPARDRGPCSSSRTPTAAGTRSTTDPAPAPSTPPASSPGPCCGSACRAITRPSRRPCVTCSPSSRTSAAGSRRRPTRTSARRCARPATP